MATGPDQQQPFDPVPDQPEPDRFTPPDDDEVIPEELME